MYPDAEGAVVTECYPLASCEAYAVVIEPASRSAFFVTQAAVSLDGRVYVAGKMNNRTLHVGGAAFPTGSSGHSGAVYDAYLVSLEADGTVEWAWFSDCPSSSVGAISTWSGGIDVAVACSGSPSRDATTFIARLGSDGVERWRVTMSSAATMDLDVDSRVRGLAARPGGGIIVSGTFSRSFEAGALNLVNPNTSNSGFILALDADGTPGWSTVAERPEGAGAFEAVALADGSTAVVVGSSSPVVPVTLTIGAEVRSLGGDAVMAIAHFDDSGSLIGFVPLAWPATAVQRIAARSGTDVSIAAIQYEPGNSRTWWGVVDLSAERLTQTSRSAVPPLGETTLASGTVVTGVLGLREYLLTGFTADGRAWSPLPRDAGFVISETGFLAGAGSRVVVVLDHSSTEQATILAFDLPF